MVGSCFQHDDHSGFSECLGFTRVMRVWDMERYPGAGFLFIPVIFSI